MGFAGFKFDDRLARLNRRETKTDQLRDRRGRRLAEHPSFYPINHPGHWKTPPLHSQTTRSLATGETSVCLLFAVFVELLRKRAILSERSGKHSACIFLMRSSRIRFGHTSCSCPSESFITRPLAKVTPESDLRR